MTIDLLVVISNGMDSTALKGSLKEAQPHNLSRGIDQSGEQIKMDDSTSRLGGNREEHNQLARRLDTLSEKLWHYRLMVFIVCIVNLPGIKKR